MTAGRTTAPSHPKEELPCGPSRTGSPHPCLRQALSATQTKNRPGLHSPRVQAARDGELFWLLTNGKLRRDMPSWSRLPDQQRWQIVRYLHSLLRGHAIMGKLKTIPNMPNTASSVRGARLPQQPKHRHRVRRSHKHHSVHNYRRQKLVSQPEAVSPVRCLLAVVELMP